MPSPVIVREPVIVAVVSPEVHIAVPAFVPAAFSVFLQIAKGEELTSRVIEHSVEDDAYTFFMAQTDKLFKVLVVSQPLIKFAVI